MPSRTSPDSSTDPWNGNIAVVLPQAPPSASVTRCPVCRKNVNDLSHHFAIEHADKAPAGATTALIPSGASLRRIIPIVLPSNQSEIPNNGDLNNVTIIPMQSTNGNHHHGYSSSSADGTRSSTPNSVESPVNLSVRKDSMDSNDAQCKISSRFPLISFS